MQAPAAKTPGIGGNHKGSRLDHEAELELDRYETTGPVGGNDIVDPLPFDHINTGLEHQVGAVLTRKRDHSDEFVAAVERMNGFNGVWR